VPYVADLTNVRAQHCDLHNSDGAHQGGITAMAVDKRSIITGGGDGVVCCWALARSSSGVRAAGGDSGGSSSGAGSSGSGGGGGGGASTGSSGSAPHGHSGQGSKRQQAHAQRQQFSLVQRFCGHSSSIVEVAVSEAFGCVVSSSRDFTAVLWDLKSGAFIQELDLRGGGRGGQHPVSCLRIHPESGDIYGSAGSAVGVWSLNGGVVCPVSELQADAGGVQQQQQQPSSGGSSGSKKATTIIAKVTSLALPWSHSWDANLQCVVTGHEDGFVRVWGILDTSELDNAGGASTSDASSGADSAAAAVSAASAASAASTASSDVCVPSRPPPVWRP
jgi:WD40 repeat protein